MQLWQRLRAAWVAFAQTKPPPRPTVIRYPDGTFEINHAEIERRLSGKPLPGTKGSSAVGAFGRGRWQ